MDHTTIAVITSYPRIGQIHGEGTVGVASYAKNTLLATVKAAKKEKVSPNIVVLAERREETPHKYTEEGIEVRRVWKRGNPFVFLQLLQELVKFPSAQTVLIEFELSMFGHFAMLFLFPVFLLFLKLMNKRIILIAHQVVSDINEMVGHVGIGEGSLQAIVINTFIGIFYSLTLRLVHTTIVFEQFLKEKLQRFARLSKIVVIPHGVEQYENIPTKENARKRLRLGDEFVILYFGFIAWYKGTDWIVKQFSEFSNQFTVQGRKNIKLIIAGGANPNHKGKQHYEEYVSKIYTTAKNSHERIQIAGFVNEEVIADYFAATDIVVLPYRTAMSSSGPLAIAYSFGKPVLLSDSLADYFNTREMKEILIQTGLSRESFLFPMQGHSFEKLMSGITAQKLTKLTNFSRSMADARSFDKIGDMMLKLVISYV